MFGVLADSIWIISPLSSGLSNPQTVTVNSLVQILFPDCRSSIKNLLALGEGVEMGHDEENSEDESSSNEDQKTQVGISKLNN